MKLKKTIVHPHRLKSKRSMKAASRWGRSWWLLISLPVLVVSATDFSATASLCTRCIAWGRVFVLGLLLRANVHGFPMFLTLVQCPAWRQAVQNKRFLYGTWAHKQQAQNSKYLLCGTSKLLCGTGKLLCGTIKFCAEQGRKISLWKF